MSYFIYSVKKDFIKNKKETAFQEGHALYVSLEKALERIIKNEDYYSIIAHEDDKDSRGYIIDGVYSWKTNNDVQKVDDFDAALALQLISGMEEGFSKEEAEQGYSLFASNDMGGALHVEKLDCIDKFASDTEAAFAAEKNGIPIIKDLPIDTNDSEFNHYVDTPENRIIIKDYLKKTRGMDIF